MPAYDGRMVLERPEDLFKTPSQRKKANRDSPEEEEVDDSLELEQEEIPELTSDSPTTHFGSESMKSTPNTTYSQDFSDPSGFDGFPTKPYLFPSPESAIFDNSLAAESGDLPARYITKRSHARLSRQRPEIISFLSKSLRDMVNI
jgi:hypothetical protein